MNENESMTTHDLGRDPLYNYGSLHEPIAQMRVHRPMDLTADHYRSAHGDGAFEQWRAQAKACLHDALQYDPGKLDLQPAVLETRETEDFICERIEFNTTPWFRVPGYFYTPKNVDLPAPALVVFHEWGGPMLFGAERVCGEPVHNVLVEHRANYTSGRAIADWYASQGYCVICIDAYHFGRRAPRGLPNVPNEYEPSKMSWLELANVQQQLVQTHLYYGVRQLNWAGTTWCGLNYYDDSRCIDYLLSRKEVDGDNIGCTGLSGGGWRTNIMAALEDRLKAVVSVGWMTTGDTQYDYNVLGAIGTFCLLPGVWNRLDIPDLINMAAPKACMVVSGRQDMLFPPRGQDEADVAMRDAFDWAGCPEKLHHFRPDKPHCYDAEIQAEALAWFDRWLKG